jgi:hypothetical protein
MFILTEDLEWNITELFQLYYNSHPYETFNRRLIFTDPGLDIESLIIDVLNLFIYYINLQVRLKHF